MTQNFRDRLNARRRDVATTEEQTQEERTQDVPTLTTAEDVREWANNAEVGDVAEVELPGQDAAVIVEAVHGENDNEVAFATPGSSVFDEIMGTQAAEVDSTEWPGVTDEPGAIESDAELAEALEHGRVPAPTSDPVEALDSADAGDDAGDPEPADDADHNDTPADPQDDTPPAVEGATATTTTKPPSKTAKVKEARRLFDKAEVNIKAVAAGKQGSLDVALDFIVQGEQTTPEGNAKAEIQLRARALRLRRLVGEVRTEMERRVAAAMKTAEPANTPDADNTPPVDDDADTPDEDDADLAPEGFVEVEAGGEQPAAEAV